MRYIRVNKGFIFFLIGIISLLDLGCSKIIRHSAHLKTSFEKPNLLETKQAIQRESKEYQISPSDILKISVYQEEDLTRTVRVSQSGCISYPLLGKIKIVGLSVSEVEEKIANLLRKEYLVNPQVTIFIEEYHPRKIFILGAVNKPGAYNLPLEKTLTVLEAISLAGGFTNLAAVDKTKIIRIEDGIEKNIVVKITDITKRGDKSKDIILKLNDIIVIPETFF